MSRYGDNIRRLAKTDELKELIRQAEQRLNILDKANIPGQRGIAYPNSSAVGTPGVTNPDNNGSQDGRSLYDNNPNNAGIDDTTTDGDALLGGANMTPGKDIGAIQLKDCDTGEQIDVRFNTGGNEGETAFKHPEGFGIGDVQPTPADVVVIGASSWVWSAGGVESYAHDDAVAGAIAAEPAAGAFVAWVTLTPRAAAQAAVTAGGEATNAQPAVSFIVTRSGGGANFQLSITGTNCNREAGTTGDIGTVCGTAYPTASSWDEAVPGTPHQLAYNAKKGGFMSSRYDSDIPLKYKNPASTGNGSVESTRGLSKLELCTPDGNPVVVETLRDGSIVYYEDDGFGAPDTATNKIQRFDQDGKFVNTITEDEWNFLKL